MKKHPRIIISLIIWAAVFLFWAFPYRAALNYHEELQFFMFDDDYLISHLTEAGGIAVYLSEALVQLYHNYLFGACILGLEFMLIYLLTDLVLSKMPRFKGRTIMTFLPIVILWVLIGDFNVMHSLIIAVLIALLLLYIVLSVGMSLTVRVIGFIVALPIFCWMCWTSHYRLPGSFVTISSIYNSNFYDAIEYDLFVRESQWDDIIKKAEGERPVSRQTMCATNLALGMKNKLLTKGEKLNKYGVQGLLPMFDHNPFSALTIAETYFHLGMINSAQRMYFESMEAIYNRNKSTRCMCRLVQTNIINGHYEVARKYLHLLEKTLLYKEWAVKTLKLLDKGADAVMSDAFYGGMRKKCLRQDFLFNDVERIDGVLGNLFVSNPDNSLAMQYLLFYALLEGNADKYNSYYNAVKEYCPNAVIPKLNTPSAPAPLMPTNK